MIIDKQKSTLPSVASALTGLDSGIGLFEAANKGAATFTRRFNGSCLRGLYQILKKSVISNKIYPVP